MTVQMLAAPVAPPVVVSRLSNGLRTVVVPDPTVHVACVAVVYDVGMRAEAPGQAGLAHLVEHLMFEGSDHVPPGGHGRLVQGVGGSFNGLTGADRTCFHQLVPPAVVDRVLALEADRLATLDVTTDGIAKQRAVVHQEVRGRLDHRPYGGFPRVPLSALLFDEHAYAHDGYGDVAALRAVLPEHVADFRRRHYRPDRAVVAVVGDVDPDEVLRSVERWFGALPGPAEPPPERPVPAPLRADRTSRAVDGAAPLPAVAWGWRVPDPADLAAYLPYVVLADVLGDVGQRLSVHTRQTGRPLAASVGAGVDLAGEPFDVRDPNGFVVTAMLLPGVDEAELLARFDTALEEVAAHGVTEAELERLHASALERTWSRVACPTQRALAVATALQHRGTPELPWLLPGLLQAVGSSQVSDAAATLLPSPRALHVVSPGVPAGPATGTRA
ncbi:MAG: insulinase family protein [Cellulomonas sp.]|uniref:M16 family metallopeptidase n=1 Tax=Cellulomonas sp. TaxID=40001 RepID=UPI0019EECD1E|nr:pitrilysin family protein [Cellulomonas sp.]MBF0688256.1 insulinase family protein [Cellulomonas sp.]